MDHGSALVWLKTSYDPANCGELNNGMLCLQANFQATEPLSCLHSFAKACLLPNAPSWHLYTTPPKQVLKDLRPTFFQAGLVPAAIVYVGMSEDALTSARQASAAPNGLQTKQMAHSRGDQLLRPELIAALGEQPSWIPKQHTDPSRPQKEAQTAADKGKGPASGSSSFKSSQPREAEGKKGPKWLKLGPKN